MIIKIILISILIKQKSAENISCPKIFALNGKIKVEPPTHCTVSANNITYNGNQELIPGVWFGLVEYKCGNCIGNLVSEYHCIDCGIYCIQNDMNVNCRNFWFPTICGSFIGILGLCAMKLIFGTLFKDVLRTGFNKIRKGKEEKTRINIIKWKRISNLNEEEPIEPADQNQIRITCPDLQSVDIKNSNKKRSNDIEIVNALNTIRSLNEDEELKSLTNCMDAKSALEVLNNNPKLVKKMKTIERTNFNVVFF